jgi:molybdopterin converting factor small subunit
MPRVIIPPPFQGPTGGQGELKVEGRTIRECLGAVESEHAGFLAQVLREDGTLQRFAKLFVNQEQVGAESLDMALDIDDEVEILAAIAGG